MSVREQERRQKEAERRMDKEMRRADKETRREIEARAGRPTRGCGKLSGGSKRAMSSRVPCPA